MIYELKSEKPQYFLQHQVSKTWHCDDISLPLDERFCSLLSDMIPLYGFHGNTNCLTADLQGLLSAAGSSLTPVCQGEAGMMEGENDPTHAGMQCYTLLSGKKL